MNDSTPQYSRIYSESGRSDEDEKLLQPLSYLLQINPTNMLKKGLTSFNYWMKLPLKLYQSIEDICVMALNANLLVDDIEDDSPIRRSRPAAHMIYGTGLTINAANYAEFIALEKCIYLGNPQAIKIVLNALLNMHRGQGLDIYWREYSKCPTEEEYIQNSKKINALGTFGFDLLQLFSEYRVDLSRLSNLLCIYHRLRNDYMSLWSDDYQPLKACPLEDITEGKFSFPIIYAVNTSSKGDDIIQILRKRTADMGMKKYCLSLIEKCDSRQYTLAKIKEIYEDILCEIDALGGNPDLEEVVKTILRLHE